MVKMKMGFSRRMRQTEIRRLVPGSRIAVYTHKCHFDEVELGVVVSWTVGGEEIGRPYYNVRWLADGEDWEKSASHFFKGASYDDKQLRTVP